MRNLICILMAGLFVFAAGAAVSISAQSDCPDTVCRTIIGPCPKKSRFFCVQENDGGLMSCFNLSCGPRKPPLLQRARTMKVRRGMFIAEDGVKMSGRLSAPLTAVFSSEDNYYIYVVRRGTVLKRTVTIGMMGETDVEIAKGLKPGDVIVKNPLSIVRRKGKK